jgi:hypothetical protein
MHTSASKALALSHRIFFAAAALYGLVLWPIVHADRFYIDDLGRSRSGYLGWGTDGRPLSNMVMEVLNFGTPLTDISPLPQLCCVLLFAYLAVAVARKFELGGVWKAPLIVAPMIANPFFLENLSYKFDSFTMSLSVVLAVLAVVSVGLRGRQIVYGGLLLLASLCLYQPALNAFLVFAVAEFVFGQQRGEPISALVRRLVLRGLQLLCALLLYKAIAASTVRGGYASEHSVLASGAALPATVWQNLQEFWSYGAQHLWFSAGGAMLGAMGLGLAMALAIALRYLARGWRQWGWGGRVFGLAALIAVPAMLYAAPWGPMLLLQNPVWAPRVMIGMGALASVSLLLIVGVLAHVGVNRKWQVFALALPVYGCVLFATVYGNSLGLQKEYENRLSEQISDDVTQWVAQGSVKRYLLRGNAGRPPVLLHNIKKFPLLKTLVPIYLTEGWGWANEQLMHFGTVTPYMVPPYGVNVDASLCDTEPLLIRNGYRFFVVGDVAVIAFRNGGCQR